MPGEGGALHARRNLRYSRERGQAAEICRVEAGILARDQAMKDLEHPFRFLPRLPLHRRAHHRGRSLRDCTAVACEGDVPDRLAVDVEKDRVVIAAEGVVALHLARRMRQLAEVPWVLVVIENDLLVQLAKLGHGFQIYPAARSAVRIWR